jgi:hypothetical protein
LLSEPGPVRFHETPAVDGSFVTVAVMATVCPSSMVCGEEGDTLTRIGGGEEEEQLQVMTVRATTNSAAPWERALDIKPLPRGILHETKPNQ